MIKMIYRIIVLLLKCDFLILFGVFCPQCTLTFTTSLKKQKKNQKNFGTRHLRIKGFRAFFNIKNKTLFQSENTVKLTL